MSEIFNTLNGQRTLHRFYMRELAAPERSRDAQTDLQELGSVFALEETWNRYEQGRVPPEMLPGRAADFGDWYHDLKKLHQLNDRRFFDFLAEDATLEQIAFYICLEEQVDGRFDDIIALAQLGLNGDAKLALAENFWDEMGRGVRDDMHTVMFEESSHYLRGVLERSHLAPEHDIPVEAYKNGNILLMYALRRRHALRLLGALTILEHSAPFRFERTVSGLRRVGAPSQVVHYHVVHISIDRKHGDDLFHRVLLPLVRKFPDTVADIALGAAIRYQIAADYYRSIETLIAQRAPKTRNASERGIHAVESSLDLVVGERLG